jgi:hypothetical protein
MAANTLAIFVESANIAAVLFQNADGTTPKDLVSAGADGTKVLRINCTSDDTVTVTMGVYLYIGGSAYLLGRVPVVTLSGTNGTAPAVNLLDATKIACLDQDGELFIPSGSKIQVAPLASVSSAKTVTVVCFAGDY